MAGKKVTETVYEFAVPLAQEVGCFIDDVEFKKEGSDYVLRVIVDKEDDENGGVSIDQCEHVSRALSDILDREDPIEQAYMLEVSSPGIDRELKKDRDFERFMGRDIDIKLYKAINGSKILSGELISYENGVIGALVDGKEMSFQKSDIASVRLAVIW